MPSKLPKDSLILISGANGFVGSHVAKQLLEQGYRVRGTVRNLEKTAWMLDHFDGQFGAGRFELVRVPDFSVPGAFDEALKGCAGFAHMASDLSFSTDPKISVEPMIKAVKSALESASNEPGLRSFVLTSSSAAVARPQPEKKGLHINKDMWNEADIELAWADSYPDETARRWACYRANKAQTEQALWQFAKERQPKFSINSICPPIMVGPVLSQKNQMSSTNGLLSAAFKPAVMERMLGWFVPQYFCHVEDTARLHVALLTQPDTFNGERLLPWSEPFNWTRVADTGRQLYPDREISPTPADEMRDESTVDNKRAVEILKQVYGQEQLLSWDRGARDGFESLMEIIDSDAKEFQ